MSFLEILTTIIGALMSVAHFPQAYTMFKNKSGANVSLVTYGLFAIGTAVWLVYGISLMQVPVLVSYGLGVIGSWLVVFLKLYYGNPAEKVAEKPNSNI